MNEPGPPFVGKAKIYPRRGPIQQYRLTERIAFRCVRCSEIKTSKLVATYGDDPETRLCNGCYGGLLALYEIKAGTLTDDIRASALSDLLLTFASEPEARDAARRGRLRNHLDSVLDPRAARFLGTAFYVAESLGDLDLDWSAAIIGLCKALEVELVARLISPLRSALAPPRESDLSDPQLRRLFEFVSNPDSNRAPEMGAVAQFLVAATQSERRATSSALIEAFRARVARFPGHLWVTSGEASTAITQITREYRNPASHTQILIREDYEACRAAIAGDNGILWTLVDATVSR